eukprot:GFUD01031995.1.p1 GENE.GFUD01031995.1~~GFUD01031995.1.p1  ORF type:complete len:396 (+),score=120.40 GFUD01031995.1:36-1223(+)
MTPPQKKQRTNDPPPSHQSTEMDPAVARRLLVEGATVVLLGVPAGTQVGVDVTSWNVGEQFMGVKMIPPGLHFVYYSAVNVTDRSTAPRTGFFHNFGRGEMVVRRWDQSIEDVVDDVADEDKVKMKQDIKNIDKHLGVYPYHSWKKWISLSNHVSDATLLRLEPRTKKICSVADLVPDEAGSVPDQPPSGDTDPRLPAMSARPGTSITYTSLVTSKYPEGSTPAEITRHSLDGTFQLSAFVGSLEKLYGDQVSTSMSDQDSVREVLAEIQFAFLCFLVGTNYDSFEQWKKLVVMMCSCDDGLVKYQGLFLDFITVLFFQMKEVPSDFFVDIVSSDNFLSSSLNSLFSTVKNSPEVNQQLKEKAKKFEANVTKKFGWDFSAELTEDGPVVVENSDE